MKVLHDEWLSAVFGYSVFGVSDCSVKSVESGRIGFTAGQHGDSRMFYYTKIPSHNLEVVRALEGKGFRVVDVNVTFSRSVDLPQGLDYSQTILVTDATAEHYDMVLDIASTSFVYSRFHLDPLIPKSTANLIKRKWINSYITGLRGDRLLVALENGKPVGFLAVLKSVFNGKTSYVIDLVAVGKQAQGKGVGKTLVYSFISYYTSKSEILRVGTQVSNKSSIRLYEKSGFVIEDSNYVMHAHFGDVGDV